MKLLIQRVNRASVTIDNTIASQIGKGLLVFIGIKQSDSTSECDYLIKKLLNLRIFPEGIRLMERNVVDCNYEILVVSQFTLYADCKKGNRPSFIQAMPPREAETVYDEFIARLKSQYSLVQTGMFGADMQVELINDGPVTIEL
ncbi:D-tyrosyl-tRNA(Tyr) deacylase [candidate division TM6 bacterium RIFCSPHIGHO2_12_FULL_36_22]|nr:MAG: D-tyrosyl-tRNA(Tyr) deacylase [candidate division TM6 bacterium RIFCSPHIGHO2_12_FULL_36_22]